MCWNYDEEVKPTPSYIVAGCAWSILLDRPSAGWVVPRQTFLAQLTHNRAHNSLRQMVLNCVIWVEREDI